MTQLEIVIKRLADQLAKNTDPQFNDDLDWAYQYFNLEDFMEMIEKSCQNE